MRKILILLLVLMISPVVTFAAFKPSRVLYPQMNNVECVKAICMEDMSRYSEAENLIKKARVIVSETLGDSGYKDKIIFCSTEKCFNSFALRRSKGITVGSFGSVINAHGWREDIVAHEMIHQWQNNQFGLVSVYLAEPWLFEGMAWALCKDLHNLLPERWAGYKSKFNEWQSTIEPLDLVSALDNEF
jgi:hypothetical protein